MNIRRKQQQLNLLPVAEDYFNNIFSSIPEMKGLLLDRETFTMISVVYTQSKLYKHDVYLIQKIYEQTEKLMHLKAVYFIRPIRQNIDIIKKELAAPRFKEYHLFFTNEITESFINEIAQADMDGNKVKNLQEVYFDYYALGRNVFSLNIPSTIGLIAPRERWAEGDRAIVTRCSQGLISLLMSLRLIPQVRYLADSDCCGEIARIVSSKVEKEFNSKPSDYLLEEKAILLITDRKEDVVTPLLIPWTYEAMLHEFIGIFNNKIDTVHKQKAFLGVNEKETFQEKQKHEFVLSELSDDFFKRNVYSGFGQLATNIKSFINDVSSKKNKSFKMESLEDMQSALHQIPELNALSATLQKHVNLSCLLSKQIEQGLLFQVSHVQQNIAVQNSNKDNSDAVWKIIRNQKIEYYLKFKLVVLFSVKYPADKELPVMLSHLSALEPNQTLSTLIQNIGQYQKNRKSDLFHMRNFKKKAQTYIERLFKDVPNVYTQHKPYLFQNVIPDVVLDKLKESEYRVGFRGHMGKPGVKPTIVLFYVGGVTYTEAKEAEAFEQARVIVGGSFIHNSKTFIGEITQLGRNDNV